MTSWLGPFLEPILELLRNGSPSAAALLVLFEVLSCVLLLPGGLLTLSAGGIFGIAQGAVLVLLGINLGAVLAFLLGRYFFQPFAAKILSRHPRLLRIEHGIENEGWLAVILIRLCPIFPFRWTNYALGASNIRLVDFVAGTAVGTMPSTLGYVALGALSGKLVGAVREGQLSITLSVAVAAVGLLALIELSRRISIAADSKLEKGAG